jgi:2-keto-3-deoxy-L-rhamnonate aldolase RhmA
VVAQIETAETDDPLEEILAAAPDVVFIGSLDLRVDLGLDAGAFERRIEEILSLVEDAGLTAGAFGIDDPRISYRVLSADLSLLADAICRPR